MDTISRRQFLRLPYETLAKYSPTLATALLLTACASDSPTEFSNPTTTEGGYSPEVVFQKYYPQLAQYPLVEQQGIELGENGMHILNYDPTIRLSADGWGKLITAYSQQLSQQQEIPYMDGVTFTAFPRERKPTVMTLLPRGAMLPNWSTYPASTTDVGEGYLAYVSRIDFEIATVNDMIAVELCQAMVRLSATVVGDKTVSTQWANDGQEIYCNSLGHAVKMSTTGMPWNEYAQQARTKTTGPSAHIRFPIITFTQNIYDNLPKRIIVQQR